jgi:hypothetical protein
MFGFTKRKAEVFSHSYFLIAELETSSDEFYSSIEAELKARYVPGLTMTRVEFAEGGLLSDKRTYLRMIRERLVFDVCAAPFGTSYFFSSRFAEIPAEIQAWQLLLLFGGGCVATLMGFSIFAKMFGLLGMVLFPVFLFLTVGLLFYILRNAIGLGLRDLDATLIKTPVLGPVYERFFRKDSYYRDDTRVMYRTIVDEVVNKKVEQLTASKGINLIRQYVHDPFLRELYQRNLIHNDQKNEMGEAVRQPEG